MNLTKCYVLSPVDDRDKGGDDDEGAIINLRREVVGDIDDEPDYESSKVELRLNGDDGCVAGREGEALTATGKRTGWRLAAEVKGSPGQIGGIKNSSGGEENDNMRDDKERR